MSDVLEHVRPERVHRGHLREEAALAAVRAAVEHEPRPAGDERAVRAGAGLELDHHALAPVADREELLAAREDELHGTPGRACERCDVTFEVEVALRAEAAAEERDDHANVRLRDAERVRRRRPAPTYGTCVEVQTVTLSPCHCATIARGSIGTPWTGSVT